MAFEDVQRALQAVGALPAFGAPASSQGRVESAATRLARVVEDEALVAHPVGPAVPCPEPVAFLDGVQRHRLIATFDAILPVVAAEVAAAVRTRRDRRLVTAIARRKRLLLGRPEALARVRGVPGYELRELPADAPEHPVLDHEAAVTLIEAERGKLEDAVAAEFRAGSDAWLLVDGSLAERRPIGDYGRMLGVSQSHAVLPFAGADLRTYLSLPTGCRSSVFEPASHRQRRVYAWALRLHDWRSRGVFHGLVRVEAARTEESLRRASEYSAWLLAERAPLSAPDARWDRLLYGIRNVEDYLRAVAAP
jgi:hypothetical protein